MKRTESKTVHLSSDEVAQLSALAEIAGMTFAEFMHSVLADRAEEGRRQYEVMRDAYEKATEPRGPSGLQGMGDRR